MNIQDPRFQHILQGNYSQKDGKIFAISSDTFSMVDEEMNSGINIVKKFLKKNAHFYEFLRAVLSPGMSIIPHMTPKGSLLKTFSPEILKDKIVVNIGSGVKLIHPEIINSDVYPYPQVSIVADGAQLPLKDNSVDMIICESVLEHVMHPYHAIQEIQRVVKPGGFIYISVPFVYPFHASPNDFTRFTMRGLTSSFDQFNIIKDGMRAGPMTALQGLLMHLCAMICSFGSEKLYLFLSNIFMILFAPLKLLDIFFTFFPYSHEIAADIYIYAQKK